MTEAPTPGLYWPIKRSFVLYIVRIADGEIRGGPGVRMSDPSTFHWDWAGSPEGTTSSTTVTFRGDLVFRAHNGALSFRVTEPAVDLAGERATLTVAADEGRLTMVTFEAVADESAGRRAWRGVDVRLTDEALAMFAGYYGAGEQFDDLRIVEPAD